MKRCNPPFHPKKTDSGFVVMDVDRGVMAEGPMSAAKAIEKADELNQPFYPVEQNPWIMHRSRLSGMFSRGGKILRVAERNPSEVNTMEMPISDNPELLTVGLNGRKRKRRKLTLKLRNGRKSRRRRRNGAKSVTYRGKRYKGFLALLAKFGKGMARKIWRSKRGKAIGHNPAKKRKGKKSNWMALVKKFGVKGAMKRRRGR